MKSVYILLLILVGSVLYSCSGEKEEERSAPKRFLETVSRKHDEAHFRFPAPIISTSSAQPWKNAFVGSHPKITKDFFRCKGSTLNPVKYGTSKNGEPVKYMDCGGAEYHSLPINHGEEFIYPVLIDLLNFVQSRTGKKIVITCGHRCPQHNIYVDASPANQTSKHLIGAEVDFYVHEMEQEPDKIVQIVMDYYQEVSQAEDRKAANFQRYTKPDTNVSTPPWYNEEIFIKLVKKNEGRDLDNRHPYPYISLQVRKDRETGEKVNYSWERAHRQLMKW